MIDIRAKKNYLFPRPSRSYVYIISIDKKNDIVKYKDLYTGGVYEQRIDHMRNKCQLFDHKEPIFVSRDRGYVVEAFASHSGFIEASIYVDTPDNSGMLQQYSHVAIVIGEMKQAIARNEMSSRYLYSYPYEPLEYGTEKYDALFNLFLKHTRLEILRHVVLPEENMSEEFRSVVQLFGGTEQLVHYLYHD